jgi:hypothetical protein
VDGVEFSSIFCFFGIVGIQSVEEKSDRCVFVLCRVVGSIRNDSACACGLPVNGGFQTVGDVYENLVVRKVFGHKTDDKTGA